MADGDTSYLSPAHQAALAAEAGGGGGGGAKEGPEAAGEALEDAIAAARALYVDYGRLSGLGGGKQRLPGLEALLRAPRSTQAQVLEFMAGR